MSGGGNGENVGGGVLGENGGFLHGDNFVIDAFAFGQGDHFGAASQIRIFFELGANGLVGCAGIVVVDVDKMQKHRCAVDMAQKVVAKAFTLGSAFDETRNVGD